MDIPSFNNVVINSANLQHNYRLIRQLLGPHTDIMAMVKSDGYGHGVEFSAQAFGETGCTKFGVAELLEGVQLRNSGCTSEILIFLGFAPSATDFLFSHNLTPVVFLKDDIHTIATHAARLKKRTDIYLKFDCGMSRLGFKPDDAQDLVSLIEDLDYLDFKGIISHYPCSDDRASCNSERVFTQFLRIVESVGKEHIPAISSRLMRPSSVSSIEINCAAISRGLRFSIPATTKAIFVEKSPWFSCFGTSTVYFPSACFDHVPSFTP